ncbi:hypothetical protein ES704_01410 [subsurface metagenome]|jgi:predicted transcriptional regulator
MKFGLFGRKKFGSNIVYGLTATGKAKAEKFEAQGPTFEILAALEERGPSSVREISEETRIGYNKLKLIIPKLVKAGFIRPQTGEEGD